MLTVTLCHYCISYYNNIPPKCNSIGLLHYECLIFSIILLNLTRVGLININENLLVLLC